MGVLDAALYQCGLSGSTWSTAKWMISPTNPFVAYKGTSAPDCWSSDVAPQTFDKVDISPLLQIAESDVLDWKHFEHYIPLLVVSRSLLKVYSVLLANKMEAATANYEDFRNKALCGKFPIPLFTATFNDSLTDLKFADYSPFEIGSMYTRTYFPLEYYQIENYDAGLPPAINDFMAVWGSAFYAKINEIITDLPEDLNKLFGNLSILPGAKILNANSNMVDPKTGAPLPLANHKYLYYKDGGIQSNTPLEPLLRPERTVDMIIVFNADSQVATQPFAELVKALPVIQKAVPSDTANVTFPYVFPSTSDYPTIVYIPLIKNAAYGSFDPTTCGTFKFHYTQEEATDLCGLAHYLTMQAESTIKNVIQSLIK